MAWYYGNSGSKTHPVGTKSPNDLGIYDMSGNVWEWCEDRHDERYYKKSPATNPTGPNSGYGRVVRGGGWSYNARGCRVSFRGGYAPDYRFRELGLRLCLSISEQ